MECACAQTAESCTAVPRSVAEAVRGIGPAITR
ncbi:Uncharacterised protein [Mycobacteroides abscessus subsp. abscessus]|nr:Uncharacterised protein [Mycobacteroides abscessus subsp. abscessus]